MDKELQKTLMQLATERGITLSELVKQIQVIENFFQQEKVQHAFQRLKYEVKNDGVEIQLMAKKPLLEKAYFKGGKTTFIQAIDERKMNKIPKSEGFANTNIRTIYFNSFIQDIVSFFTNALFDAITTLKVDTKIPLYPIADKFRNKPSASHLIELLEYYRQIYYQNMWEVIALKPVTRRISENEMLLSIHSKYLFDCKIYLSVCSNKARNRNVETFTSGCYFL